MSTAAPDAGNWRVTKATIGEWEVGYCRISGQPWVRIWIRRDRATWMCHVFDDGNSTFDLIGRGAPREVYDALFAAVDRADEFDPGVYCHPCSVAGGAERPIYHLPPACGTDTKGGT